jgi:hypothetical protein
MGAGPRPPSEYGDANNNPVIVVESPGMRDALTPGGEHIGIIGGMIADARRERDTYERELTSAAYDAEVQHYWDPLNYTSGYQTGARPPSQPAGYVPEGARRYVKWDGVEKIGVQLAPPPPPPPKGHEGRPADGGAGGVGGPRAQGYRPADEGIGVGGPRSLVWRPADDGAQVGGPRGSGYRPSDDSPSVGGPRALGFRPADDDLGGVGPRSTTTRRLR